MKNPRDRAEWQEAINAAHVLTLIHAARLYGLITGGPEINLASCEEILSRGRMLGYAPDADAIEKAIGVPLGGKH